MPGENSGDTTVMSQTSSAESSVTEYVMNKKLGAIAMLLSATGMGLVGTISRGTTAGLADATSPLSVCSWPSGA